MTQTYPETAVSLQRSLARYRFMAYVVGVLLAVLVCIGMPMKYLGDSPGVVHYLGAAHGYLYLMLIFSIADLARRRRFPVKWILAVALAGTVPFLSFVAERAVTSRVRDGRL